MRFIRSVHYREDHFPIHLTIRGSNIRYLYNQSRLKLPMAINC